MTGAWRRPSSLTAPRMEPRRLALLAALVAPALACNYGERPTQQQQQLDPCLSCHQPERKRAVTPDHLDDSFPTACQRCHTQLSWSPASLDHGKLPLVGKHSYVACKTCHSTEPVPKECVGCHDRDRKQPDSPDHLAAGFPTRCQDCHTVWGWKPAALDHSKFPFVGGHSAVACTTCHPDASNPNKPKATTCNGCHDKDRSKPSYPNHLDPKFPTGCETCHSVYGWKDPSYSHNKFPLIGKHSTVTCAKCHAKSPVPTTCYGCHDKDRSKPSYPNHLDPKFSTTCNTCHSVNGWKPVAKDHSKFPLTGRHSGVACTKCHPDPKNPAKPTATTCYGCHKADTSKPKLPVHTAAGFSTDCKKCHTTGGWKPAAYDHTKFPLTGGHGGLACAKCHSVSPVPTTCYGCHKADMSKPTSPDHLASGFSTKCDSCHTATAWKPATTNHSKFPLTGGHAGAACVKCHTDPQNPSTPTATTCYGCHKADMSKPTSPDHLVSGFPTKCDSCHDKTAWKGATYTHTKFPLTGKHLTLGCTKCHADPTNPAKALGTTCYDCHKALISKPTNPSHTTAGFSTQCDSCHTTNGWKPASFNHSKFPLTGKHSGLGCAKCHPDPNSPKTPTATTCYGCHKAALSTATLPDHTTSGFSTDCKLCHSVNGWKPSSWDHSQYFPIASGKHAKPCSSCHTDLQNAKYFSCLGTCHEHTQSKMDNEHSGKKNYSYTFSACLNCHPNGK